MKLNLHYSLIRPLQQQARRFTREELAYYNGQGGRPTYAALNGVVYDLTGVPSWRGGTHFGLAAGRELGSEYADCHQPNPVDWKQYPTVGRLGS